MATRAPGQDSTREDPECYNCGTKGHFMIACPEPIRKVPAGLAAHRQRQAGKPGSGAGGAAGNAPRNRHSRGMIITRYGPPPSANPQVPHYPPPQLPSAPQLPAAPHLPPAPRLPPAPHLPHPPPRSVASAPAPAPGPVPVPYPHQADPWQQQPPYPQPAYANPYPSGPALPPTSYDAYGAPPPHPAPGLLGPPQPPGGRYYQPDISPGRPTYYQPPVSGPPVPPPYAPNPYPQAPGPSIPLAPPPPAGYQQPGYGQPTRYPFASPMPSPNPSLPAFPPPVSTWGPSPPTNGWGQKDGRSHATHGRTHHRNRHGKGKGSKHGPGWRSASEQTVLTPSLRDVTPTERTSKAREAPAKLAPEVKVAEATPAAPTAPAAPATPAVPAAPASERDEKDIEFEWELKAIFNEIETKAADAVGQPLPAEWNDDPTIPPAFDAKVVKSEFFNADDEAEFSRSIRQSLHWRTIKFDPSFKCRRGMVRRCFPGDPYVYPTYSLPSQVRKDTTTSDSSPAGHDFESPWSPVSDVEPDPQDLWSPRVIMASVNNDLSGGRGLDGKTISHDGSPVTVKRDREDDFAVDTRENWKRARHSSPQPSNGVRYRRDRGLSSPGRRVRERSPVRISYQEDWGHVTSNNTDETRPASTRSESQNGRDRMAPMRSGGDSYTKHGESPRYGVEDEPYSSRPRHDSGYHSGQSAERRSKSERGRAYSDKMGSKSRRQSISRERRPCRGSGGALQVRTRSPTPVRVNKRRSPSPDSRSSSPLDDLELEMLGMIRPEEDRSKRTGFSGQSSKKKPQKLAPAFSRRW